MTRLSYLDVRNIKTWKTRRKENRQGGTIFLQSLPLIDYSTVSVKITNYNEMLGMPLESAEKNSHVAKTQEMCLMAQRKHVKEECIPAPDS